MLYMCCSGLTGHTETSIFYKPSYSYIIEIILPFVTAIYFAYTFSCIDYEDNYFIYRFFVRQRLAVSCYGRDFGDMMF